MGAIASQITSLTIVKTSFIQTQIKENIKAPRHWALCGPVNSPHKWPVTRKYFHLMTSSWYGMSSWQPLLRLLYFNRYLNQYIATHMKITCNFYVWYPTTWPWMNYCAFHVTLLSDDCLRNLVIIANISPQLITYEAIVPKWFAINSLNTGAGHLPLCWRMY